MVAPLEGIRVVEVANWLAAPSCAALMADMGADVIKIEPPGGDSFRNANMRAPDGEEAAPLNYPFELDNRGKRSVTVALNQPEGAAVVHRLATGADVFITNLLQRRRAQYSLRVEDIQSANPRCIYVSFSGFGTEGPEAERAGFDYAAFWARSGIMSLVGDVSAAPSICRPGQGDHTTAMNLLAATLAALRLRDLTGEGQVVDVTLAGTGLWTIGADVSRTLNQRNLQPARFNRVSPANPLVNAFECSDGRWLLLSMPQPDPYWPALCRVTGHPEWREDARFSTLAARTANSRELTTMLGAIFAAATRDEWSQRLNAAGLLWAPVAQLPELVNDPAIRGLGVFETVDDPRRGPFETLSAPFKIRGADIHVRGAAPGAGAHTFEVLQEAGFTPDELAELAAAGVFG